MLRLGLVGAGSARSQQISSICAQSPSPPCEVCAAFDPDPAQLAAIGEPLQLDLDTQGFVDYGAMLDCGLIDAVLIGSPMQYHAEQTIAALDKGIHVLCEVTAAVTLEECREVVMAANRSPAQYMMAENYCYAGFTRYISDLCRRGHFGELHYAEAEYMIHAKVKSTAWRRHWMVGRKGITYGTHSLGPVLQWFNAAAAAAPGGSSGGGDRVCSLSCVDSGSHYADEAGMPYASDGAVLLGKTIKGRLIKLRLDLVSAQPGGQRHRLQGTRGVFEATNANAREGRLSLLPESILDDAPLDTKVMPGWTTLAEAMASWDDAPSLEVDMVEHMLHDFAQLCQSGRADRTGGVHGAMDLTIPGLVSELSAEREGEWMAVPDSRDWGGGEEAPVATLSRI